MLLRQYVGEAYVSGGLWSPCFLGARSRRCRVFDQEIAVTPAAMRLQLAIINPASTIIRHLGDQRATAGSGAVAPNAGNVRTVSAEVWKASATARLVSGGSNRQPYRRPSRQRISAVAEPAPLSPTLIRLPTLKPPAALKRQPVADRSSTSTACGARSPVRTVLGRLTRVRACSRRPSTSWWGCSATSWLTIANIWTIPCRRHEPYGAVVKQSSIRAVKRLTQTMTFDSVTEPLIPSP